MRPNLTQDLLDTLDPSALDDPRYRFYLWRSWAQEHHQPRYLGWVMLNPSTADQTVDDPTIRRCMGFARRDGFTGIMVSNLYPLRATSPADLWATPEGRRLGNEYWADEAIRRLWPMCEAIVVAWGSHGARAPHRTRRVLDILDGAAVYHLGTTKDGEPRHPLMLASSTPMERL